MYNFKHVSRKSPDNVGINYQFWCLFPMESAVVVEQKTKTDIVVLINASATFFGQYVLLYWSGQCLAVSLTATDML